MAMVPLSEWRSPTLIVAPEVGLLLDPEPDVVDLPHPDATSASVDARATETKANR
jgi:hypothetical protein